MFTLTRDEKREAFHVAIALQSRRASITPQLAVTIAMTQVLYRTRRAEIADQHK